MHNIEPISLEPRVSSFQTAMQPSFHRVIGVGNAGVNFLDRLLVSNPFFLGLVAINSDLDALTSSVVPTQLALASEEDLVTALAKIVPQFEKEIEEASLILFCGGLGGETASTLLPHLATVAKKWKKLTLACVTQPFSFEAKRAHLLAAQSLSSLKQICDGVVLVDNNQFAASSASRAAVGETFVASDEAMQLLLPNILTMLSSKGPVRINRSHLLKALSKPGENTYFGYGQASGSNRLYEAMERLFKTPQLQRGRVLTKNFTIFMQLRGPKDLSFAEAHVAMQELERIVGDEPEIELSVSAEEPIGTALQIFILAIEKEVDQREPVPLLENRVVLPKKSKSPTFEAPLKPPAKTPPADLPLDLAASSLLDIANETQKTAVVRSATKLKQRQGALNFTAAQRGRFDKSEPTIVEGEDLDTPTYLRLGLKLE